MDFSWQEMHASGLTVLFVMGVSVLLLFLGHIYYSWKPKKVSIKNETPLCESVTSIEADTLVDRYYERSYGFSDEEMQQVSNAGKAIANAGMSMADIKPSVTNSFKATESHPKGKIVTNWDIEKYPFKPRPDIKKKIIKEYGSVSKFIKAANGEFASSTLNKRLSGRMELKRKTVRRINEILDNNKKVKSGKKKELKTSPKKEKATPDAIGYLWNSYVAGELNDVIVGRLNSERKVPINAATRDFPWAWQWTIIIKQILKTNWIMDKKQRFTFNDLFKNGHYIKMWEAYGQLEIPLDYYKSGERHVQQ